jgi:type IV pilus assembly protein PilN
MIRINLLAVDRAVTKKGKSAAVAMGGGGAGVSAAQRVTIGAALILLSTVVTIGWWFWSLRQTGIRLDDEISRAEIEANQLRSVLSSVQKFETRKAQLQQRVNLIEQLRRGQTGPVHILDEMSKALPDRMWLISMSQHGTDFTVAGQTTSLTGVSDFVANLEASKWFKRPVEIIDSAVEQTAQGDLVRFTIRATTDNPDTAPPAPVPAGRGAPPPAR